MGDKKRTHEIFGEFIDRYTIKEAEADGATVPVLYEGRTANGAIKDGASLDELFEDLFRQHTPEELEAIKKKYATKGHIFDAPALIADKARDIFATTSPTSCPTATRPRWWPTAGWRRFAISRPCIAARDELLAEAEGAERPRTRPG
jgi:type I restriction enzyme R subunit